MKLVMPTSFQVLRVLNDRKRQTAPNLAEILEKDSRYMNNQLNDLAGQGLVRRVGPSENSKMFEITEKGQVAVEHAEEYSHHSATEFGRLVDRILKDRQASDTNQEMPVSTIHLSTEDFELLDYLQEKEMASIKEIATALKRLPGIIEAGLARLEAENMVEEREENEYRLTKLGSLTSGRQNEYENIGARAFTNKISKELILKDRSEE